ncbi:transposase [Paraburkholderia azotifigens]|nr:transposase [Paraburkholderia azotifigens]
MWFDRFVRVDGKLRIVAVTESGQTEMLTPTEMKKAKLGGEKGNSISFKTSFNEWERASAREYAAVFGVKSHVTEQHDVYRIPSTGTSVVVPAWLLQRALLSDSVAIVKYVYLPNGLEELCSPILDEREFRTEMDALRPLYGIRVSPSVPQRLNWFYAYPSAYRTWNSIYRFACSGKIALDLPAAEVFMSAHGHYVDDVFYARSIVIMELKPLELPVEWARVSATRYFFEHGMRQHHRARKTRDSRLLPTNDGWKLTDGEWSVIKEIVSSRREYKENNGGRPLRYELRDILNGIVVKMGTGMGWTELDDSSCSYNACNSLHSRMQSDGRWNEIVEFLAASRGTKQ